MKRTIGYVVLAFLLVCTGDLYSQLKGNRAPTAEELLNNSAQGREFWIAMPPNEADDAAIQTRALEIYVTASVNTEVTLEMPGLGIGPITKPVTALDITTFSDLTGELSWAMEVRESEIVTDKGILLTSDDAISVYVMTAKQFSSEGYLALPTNVWDRQYMHCSYYDYPETSRFRGGGFVIVAKEDETQVVFRLDGSSAGGTTKGGKSIGQPYSVSLNKGQTYMVRGTGIDRAFDMTGTKITATKPIGLIAFHQRTIIPTAIGQTSRDVLAAMIPPLATWGKRYISLELKRENRGDYFRILASQPNTKYEVRYYDKENDKELLGIKNGTLSDAGDWAEFEEVNPQQGGAVSIRGTAIWEADKPVFVMQYSYSAVWDNAQEFDPFMVQVVPQEQYIPATVFQTPSNAEFTTNWFNIIAEGDPNDPSQENLRSIILDGEFVVKKDPLFLVNQIPETNLYWARINLQPGAHRISSNGKTKFGGYIYGFSRWESYGWPAAMALNKLDKLDTVPPPLEVVEDCGQYCITATELVNGDSKDDPRQEDTGISAITMIEGEDPDNPISYNYELELKTAPVIKPDPMITRFEFCFNVIDPTKDAKAVFTVLDRAGNVTIDSVFYTADLVEMVPDPVQFGNILLGESGTQQAILRNPTTKILEVRKVELERGDLFTIVGPQRVLDASEEAPLLMEPSEEITVELMYTPDTETTDLEDPEAVDRDFVKAETECLEFPLAELIGRGVTPSIWVADYNVGVQPINKRVCKSQSNATGVLVRNIGTADLTIETITLFSASSGDLTAGPFVWDGGNPNPMPQVTIKPGEEQVFTTICFESAVSGDYVFEVDFNSNAKEEYAREYKPRSNWRGSTIESAPFVGNYDFGQVRVGATVETPGQTVVQFINFGENEVFFKAPSLNWQGQPEGQWTSGPYTITSIYFVGEGRDLRDDNNSYSIGSTDPDADPSTWDPANIVEARISYTPTAEGVITETIIPPFFVDRAATQRIDRAGYAGTGEVTGEGIIPKIIADGYDFAQIMCNTESEERGFVTITSDPNASEPLTIYSLEFENQGANPNYSWEPAAGVMIAGNMLTFDTPRMLPIGQSMEVDVAFAANGGPDNVNVTISHDAHENDPALVDPATTVVQITGSCDTPGGMTVTNLDFGDRLLCATPTLTITASTDNPSGATIENMYLENNSGEFVIVTPTPIQVPGNGSVEIEIQFTPSGVGTFTDVVILEHSLGADLRSVIEGEAHTVTVNFDLEDDRTPLTPGLSTDLDLTINNTDTDYNDTQECGIVGAIVTLNYDLGAARLKEVRPVAGANLIGDIEHSRVDGYSKFTLRFDAPVSAEGLLAQLNFQLYLHDETTLPIGLSVEILEESRRVCVLDEEDPGSLSINPICLNDGRFITLSGTTFGLRNVAPNPVNGSTTIAYSVGFRAYTNVVLYNSMGEVVKVLVDQPMDAGVYEIELDASELPAGVYTYTMTAGPYQQAHSMVVTK